MRKLIVFIALAMLGAASVDRCWGHALLPRENHPWGRFGAGSWKRVRVLTETLDDQGRVASTSTTETTSTLVSSSDTSYTLRVEVTVDVGGKRFSVPPQVITQGYSGESTGQRVEVRKVGDSTVTINGEPVPSELREIVVNGGETNRISRVHYSPDVAPFVLRRETTSTDPEGRSTSETNVEVVAFDMPYKIMSGTKDTAYVRTVSRNTSGTTVTLEVNSDEVPGGVVAHTAKETDAAGNVIRRSTLELADYHIQGDEPIRSWRQRRIDRRSRR